MTDKRKTTMLSDNTIILRYAYPHKEMNEEKHDEVVHELNTKFAGVYGLHRVDRAFYDDGGFPSRIVMLVFRDSEAAESLWKKLEQKSVPMPKCLTKPTPSDLTYLAGQGEVFDKDKKKVIRRDGGFTWRLKHMIL